MQTQSTHHPVYNKFTSHIHTYICSNGFTCSGWVDVSCERDRLNVIVGIVGNL